MRRSGSSSHLLIRDHQRGEAEGQTRRRFSSSSSSSHHRPPPQRSQSLYHQSNRRSPPPPPSSRHSSSSESMRRRHSTGSFSNNNNNKMRSNPNHGFQPLSQTRETIVNHRGQHNNNPRDNNNRNRSNNNNKSTPPTTHRSHIRDATDRTSFDTTNRHTKESQQSTTVLPPQKMHPKLKGRFIPAAVVTATTTTSKGEESATATTSKESTATTSKKESTTTSKKDPTTTTCAETNHLPLSKQLEHLRDNNNTPNNNTTVNLAEVSASESSHSPLDRSRGCCGPPPLSPPSLLIAPPLSLGPDHDTKGDKEISHQNQEVQSFDDNGESEGPSADMVAEDNELAAKKSAAVEEAVGEATTSTSGGADNITMKEGGATTGADKTRDTKEVSDCLEPPPPPNETEEDDAEEETMGHAPSKYEHLPDGDRALVQIGTRVAVYWGGDGLYFEGMVTKERPHKKKRFFVEYDDGDTEWLSLNKVQFKILEEHDNDNKVPKEKSQPPAGNKGQTEPSATDLSHDEGVNDDNNAPTEPQQPVDKDIQKEEASVAVPTVQTEPKQPVKVQTTSQQSVKKVQKERPSVVFTHRDWVNDDDWVAGALKQNNHNNSSSDDEDEDKGSSSAVEAERKHEAVVVETGAAAADVTVETTPVTTKKPKKQPPPTLESPVRPAQEATTPTSPETPSDLWWQELAANVQTSISEKVKFGRRRNRSVDVSPSHASPAKEEAKKTAASTPKEEDDAVVKEFDKGNAQRTKKRSRRVIEDHNTDHEGEVADQNQQHKHDNQPAGTKKGKPSNSNANMGAPLSPPRLKKKKPKRRPADAFPVAEEPPAKKKKVKSTDTLPVAEESSPKPKNLKSPPADESPAKKKKKKILKLPPASPVSSSVKTDNVGPCSPGRPRAASSSDSGAPVPCGMEDEDVRRRKEESRTLTPAEVAAILGEDTLSAGSSNWVRRSSRMPSRAALNATNTQVLLYKLTTNDPDVVVLKMKKYISDPSTPPVVLDAVLDALEENTNCESLYIQNYNEGMKDAQVLRLLSILQKPSCNIWCLNIGETYKVKRKTWKRFARGLEHTKITHMYASEHTISPELKEYIRITIRENRAKHNMHIDPENLDTIVKCTHCWWNPVNAKVLRPYLHAKGYAHILEDKEAQGARGTMSAERELI